MENKSKNTSEISQWIDNYLHISLDTEEYLSLINISESCPYKILGFLSAIRRYI